MRIRASWGHDGKKAQKVSIYIFKIGQQNRERCSHVRNSLVISFAEGSISEEFLIFK